MTATEETIAKAKELKIRLDVQESRELGYDTSLDDLFAMGLPGNATLHAQANYDDYEVVVEWRRPRTEEELQAEIRNFESRMAAQLTLEKARYEELKRKFEGK
jgi:hypothetical protein